MFRCCVPKKKALADKRKQKQREREKREKKRRIEQDRVRAKEEKLRAKAEKDRAKQVEDLAKEGQVLAAKYHINPTHVYQDLHPLDKKAFAKEKRIRNESIEVPNAGPEPDIPTEFQPKPPVKSISSLMSWGRKSQ